MWGISGVHRVQSASLYGNTHEVCGVVLFVQALRSLWWSLMEFYLFQHRELCTIFSSMKILIYGTIYKVCGVVIIVTVV